MTPIVRTVVTFAVLLAGYFGYEHGYALLAARLEPPTPASASDFELRPSDSPGAQMASDLALRVFGEHHWSAGTVSNVTKYYNNERGYWMYWSSIEFPEEHERKQVVLAPFAVIWGSNKDGSVKVLAGDRAIIDFDEPFSLLAQGPKPSVVHAKIEGIDEQVLILDDKATPDPADDLVVTMPYAEYFEQQMQIRCEEHVQLVEGGYTVSGRGLIIALRPSESSGGFPGAEVVTLSERVVITADDVGGSGLLPGEATPGQQVVVAGAGGPAADRVKTPGRLTCDGPMRLQLPKPRLPARVGPPAPGQPTIAEFSRNVVIERGADQPDRITGDHLYAILVPEDESEPAPAVAEAEAEAVPATGGAGSGGGLRLLEARVDGHVVWLESPSERIRCRGNELIYRKPEQEAPDVSYFRADAGQQIEFERTEPGGQLVTILTTDATLLGDREHKGRSTIVARGPGLLEMRSARGAAVERSATWRDEMMIETALSPATPDDKGSRTFVTLQGWPILNDPKQLTLAAREKVVVSLMPRPAAPAPETSAGAEDGGDGTSEPKVGGRSYRIEWVSAVGDVHLVTPDGVDRSAPDGKLGKSRSGRMLNAREKLDVVFSYLDDTAPAGGQSGAMTEAGRPGDPAARTVLASQSGGVGVRTIGARSDVQGPTAVAPPAPPAAETVATEANAPEPGRPFSADADLVWARIEVAGDGPGLDLTGKTGGKQEVREARLRRNVVIHQDPAPGKDVGFHVDADSGVDVENVGPGRLRIFAHGERRPVTVASDDVYIQGFPEDAADGRVVLGVDQAYDFAFVQGPGRLWNLSKKADMGRLDRASTRRDEAPDENKEPLIVTWAERMTFYGRFASPDGRQGPARAHFLGDVKSRNGDAGVLCRQMEAIFDRPISFDRDVPGLGGSNGANPGADGEEDRVEIDSVICNGNVRLWSVVRDAKDPEAIRELREAEGESVTFDRPADRFWIDGAGTVSVVTRDDGRGGDEARILPTAAQAGPDAGRDTSRAPTAPKLHKLKVGFNDGLEGQLGSAAGGYRVAQFSGDARAIRARVSQFRDPLDFDRPPADAIRLDGDTIYVEHNPAQQGIPERTFLKAFGAAQGRADGKSLLGDTITYDTNTARFYVQGSAAAPVTIATQEAAGQPLSRTYSRALSYNTRTEEMDALEPGSGIFLRPDTSFRLGLASVDEKQEEVEPERPEARLPARSDMERQGFTGN